MITVIEKDAIKYCILSEYLFIMVFKCYMKSWYKYILIFIIVSYDLL